MLQDGWYQCPICGFPMNKADYDAYDRCPECEEDFMESEKLLLEIERMEGEGNRPGEYDDEATLP